MDAALTAAEAVRLAAIDTGRALELADEARASLRAAPAPETEAVIERALGLVGIELGQMPDAVRHLRRAVRIAEAAGEPGLAAEARLDLSAALVLHGRPESGLAEAERARAVLTGPAAARSLMRRALILQRRGHYREALDGYRQALAILRRAGDREYEARLLCNRGILHAFRGEFATAEADLRRAERLHTELGRPLQAAHIHHNLAWLAARRGDAPEALALYDATDEEYRRLGSDRGILLHDRCEVLLSVNLVAESRETAEQAVAELARSHLDADLPEARLTLSHAALLDDDPVLARDEAARADRAFTRQRRHAWAALARHARLRAQWAAGERSRALLAAARRDAADLAARGWAAEALDARIIAGRVALELGLDAAAAAELGRAAAARRRGHVRLRVAAWHAEALLRSARDNARGARAAVAAGLRVIDAHRAALGATELRAQATAHAAELAAMGIRLAAASGSARRVLAASERGRASTWHARPRPPQDAALAGDLAQLRAVSAEIREALLDGRDPAALLLRQRQLEDAVRRRAHHERGVAGDAPAAVATIGEIAERLGERALVEYIDADGSLLAVTVCEGRARLWDLGPVAAAATELGSLAFAQRRLALGCCDEEVGRAFAQTAGEAARRLDALLLAPVAGEIGERELVVIPCGELHATPWHALATCRGRAVTAAPSATLWHRCSAAAAGRNGAGPLLVAGPGLPEAAAEVRELAGDYPRATSLVGEGASVAAVTEAFATAPLAHIAAHGSFRGDNPLFSALHLADGPLTVYDLEAAGRAPERLILSACDSALASVVGEELMGLVSALFTLGTRTVVGSVMPVRDDHTRTLMVALHARLRAGAAPAVALAETQAELAGPTAFVCFGTG
ncbi:MAG TPA: CHAT domain-containing protein [Solirubrobacteraceae bacterium]